MAEENDHDELIEENLEILQNVKYSFSDAYGLVFIDNSQYAKMQSSLSILRRIKGLDSNSYRVLNNIFKHYYENFAKIKLMDSKQPRIIAQKFIGKRKIREFIIKRDKKCLRCGRLDKLTIDHIIPISKGGQNKIGNLQTLCKGCNSIKRDTYIDYRVIIKKNQINGRK